MSNPGIWPVGRSHFLAEAIVAREGRDRHRPGSGERPVGREVERAPRHPRRGSAQLLTWLLLRRRQRTDYGPAAR